MKQKEVFLSGEGDSWFERNHQSVQERNYAENDSIVLAISRIFNHGNKLLGDSIKLGKLLEIGCGEGKRLKWLQQNYALECYGIDPSSKAIEAARLNGISASIGTADKLPYENKIFDFVVFGFCLYLIDREDLFRISEEADRVLKTQGWIIIHDFYSKTQFHRKYHHKDGIYTYKMDYRNLFEWHPAYTCFFHEVHQHSALQYTDDPNEWVCTTILRKNEKI